MAWGGGGESCQRQDVVMGEGGVGLSALSTRSICCVEAPRENVSWPSPAAVVAVPAGDSSFFARNERGGWEPIDRVLWADGDDERVAFCAT